MASKVELLTIRNKARSLQVRNNRISRIVTDIDPDQTGTADKVELWHEAMTALEEQAHAIQELIGMTT